MTMRGLGFLILGGCTVSATTPVEPGSGLTASGDDLSIDPASVPVVAECAQGQFVRRTADGWECAAVAAGSVALDCAAGTSVRAVDAEGNVSCEPDDDTTYDAGDGLTLAGTTFAIEFGGDGTAATAARSDHAHDYLPMGTTLACSGFDKVRGIDPLTGDVVCDVDVDTGTGTPYTAGAGLSLAANEFALAFAGFACGGTDKLAGFDALGGPVCDADAGTTYGAGAGLDLVGTTFSTSFADTACSGTDKVSGFDLNGDPICTADEDTDTTYSPGAGLDLVGTTFSTSFANTACPGTQKISGFDAAGAPVCTADVDTNTTYSAGAGLDLVGTTFDVSFAGVSCSGTDKLSGFDLNGDPICSADTHVPGRSPRSNTLTGITTGGSTGRHPSIAIAPDGFPVISHQDGAGVGLRVVKCGDFACSSGNTSTAVDTVGESTSIAIGADGLPVIAYWDNTNLDLKVAHCGDGDCAACGAGGTTCTTLDATGDVGRVPSIAIGTDGYPVISYHDSTNGDLKVAKCGSISCNSACGAGTTCTAVDAANAGNPNSVTIGTDGFPVIAYANNSADDLKIAKCGTASCNAACGAGTTCTTVDTAGPTLGSGLSINIGDDGLPVVSYRGGAGVDLMVAKCGTASCSAACGAGTTCSVVDTADGYNSSLTIGSDGLPFIAYMDNNALDTLKTARCGNASCSSNNTLAAIDDMGNGGGRVSVGMGADGLPIVAYWEAVTTNLKVAKCANAFCLDNWSRR